MFNLETNKPLAETFTNFQMSKVVAEFQVNDRAYAFVLTKDSHSYSLFECQNGLVYNNKTLARIIPTFEAEAIADAKNKLAEAVHELEERLIVNSHLVCTVDSVNYFVK